MEFQSFDASQRKLAHSTKDNFQLFPVRRHHKKRCLLDSTRLKHSTTGCAKSALKFLERGY